MNLDKAAQLMAGLDTLLERLDRDADLQELEAEAERDAEAGQVGGLGVGPCIDGMGGSALCKVCLLPVLAVCSMLHDRHLPTLLAA